MSFNVSHILNKNINVIGSKSFEFFKLEPMDASEEIVLFDNTSQKQPTIIDFIDWVPKHENDCQLGIEINASVGDQLNLNKQYIINYGSNAIDYNRFATPRTVVDNISGLAHYFEVIKYDTRPETPNLRFRLKEPIYAPEGIKIVLRNASSTDVRLNAFQVKGRLL